MSGLVKQGATNLAHFKPAEAVKEIAMAEALEKWARRAKDPEQLYAAVEHKARNQRDFVLWWDAQEKDKGGRPSETRDRSAPGYQLDGYGLDRKTVSRWRQRFLVPDDPGDESKRGSIVAIVVAGDPEHMTVNAYGLYWHGKFYSWRKANFSALKIRIRSWVKWAQTHRA